MFFLAAETLTLAALLATLWVHKPEKRHNLFLAAGFAATGFGVTLVALRGQIDSFVSIQVGNIIALSAYSFWLAGLMRLEDRKIEGWIAIPPLVWVAAMFIEPVRESMASRILLYHICAGIGYFMLAGMLLSHKGHISGMRKLLAAVLLLQAFSGAITAGVVIPFNLLTGQVVPMNTPIAFSGALSLMAVIMISAKMFMEDNERHLRQLAKTDHLTGAFNRRGLHEEFDRIKDGAANSGKHIAIILFDIDHFKKINDNYGHQVGDQILVHFCDLANRILGDQGVFVRMGGEEFAVIAEMDAPTKATAIAEAVRTYLARAPIKVGPESAQVTVSAGIATELVDDADLSNLLTLADRALYVAKKCGRNRTVVYDGTANVVVPAEDRPENPQDNNADRQVAALKRITTIANR
jgi:diguanylate cyclase (GGDEF)-like protein